MEKGDQAEICTTVTAISKAFLGIYIERDYMYHLRIPRKRLLLLKIRMDDLLLQVKIYDVGTCACVV